MSISIRNIIVVAFLVLTSFKLHSQETQNNEFQYWIDNSIEKPETTAYLSGQATRLLDIILSTDHSATIGGFNLTELRRQIQTVKWRAYVGPQFMVGPTGARSTAVYSVKNRMVVVSRQEWFGIDDAIRGQIAFHEALGALGYRDEKYQITVAMTLLSTLIFSNENPNSLDTRILRDNLNSLLPMALASAPLNDIQTTDQTPTYFAGGISLTGGGGDEYSITIKYMALIALTKRWSLHRPKTVTLRHVFTAILESDLERTVDDVKLGQPLIDNTSIKYDGQTLSLVVPKNRRIIDPRRFTIAADYASYLCDEIITVMDGFKKP